MKLEILFQCIHPLQSNRFLFAFFRIPLAILVQLFSRRTNCSRLSSCYLYSTFFSNLLPTYKKHLLTFISMCISILHLHKIFLLLNRAVSLTLYLTELHLHIINSFLFLLYPRVSCFKRYNFFFILTTLRTGHT